MRWNVDGHRLRESGMIDAKMSLHVMELIDCFSLLYFLLTFYLLFLIFNFTMIFLVCFFNLCGFLISFLKYVYTIVICHETSSTSIMMLAFFYV